MEGRNRCHLGRFQNPPIRKFRNQRLCRLVDLADDNAALVYYGPIDHLSLNPSQTHSTSRNSTPRAWHSAPRTQIPFEPGSVNTISTCAAEQREHCRPPGFHERGPGHGTGHRSGRQCRHTGIRGRRPGRGGRRLERGRLRHRLDGSKSSDRGRFRLGYQDPGVLG